jgi:putative thioredoxin
MYSFDVDASNFEAIVIKGSQQQPVLVDIWAPWCGPCKSLKPLLEKLAEEYQGKFILAKLNSDENPAIAQQLGVRGIPTVKAVYQGNLVNEFTGALPEPALREFLASVIPSPAQDLRQQALDKANAGENEAALALLDQALEMDSDNEQLAIDKAGILIAQGEMNEARELLNKLPARLQLDDKVKEMFTKIDISEKSADLADTATLQQTITAEPDNLQARLDLANAYIAQQHYADAVEQCFEIIKRDRDFQDDIGRKTVLDIFTLLGSSHELVRTARRQLASLLN